MSFEFTETLTIEVPDVERQMAAFEESKYKETHGLIVEVAAIHEGMTSNYNFYPAKALEGALESWVRPYPKPIIMNHDPYSEPVGRVMAAKMEKEADGTPYVMLQVAITDAEAITKVMDGRYLTGSVGGSAKQANCSVCGVDWAEASMSNIPCKHRRGKTYKGKLCYMEMNGIGFKEYSFVNMPADQLSGVRGAKSEEDGDGWVRAARVFSLNMDDEEILEFSESEEDSENVLSSMKKKDATPVYMQLKGAFLSALAVSESERGSKANQEELDVDTEIINEEEEDILAVAEGLASDLASTDEEESVEEEETTEEAEEEVSEEEVSEEEELEEEEETVEEEEETEEAEKPEGQESPRSADIDPEDSSGAPVSREDEEVVDAELKEEEEVVEEEADSTDLDEAVQALESRVEELQTREQTLLEENAKLKAALKRNLAERVVDMKIALGFADAENRESELTEHADRSAASLADSLRDLAGMKKVTTTEFAPPVIEQESAAVQEDNSIVVEDGEEEELVEEDGFQPEEVFVDVLMGRRNL